MGTIKTTTIMMIMAIITKIATNNNQNRNK